MQPLEPDVVHRLSPAVGLSELRPPNGQSGVRNYDCCMPTPAARAAFKEAQKLTARMREIHAEELELHDLLHESTDADETCRLQKRIIALRSEWLSLSTAYLAAIAVFMAELAKV